GRGGGGGVERPGGGQPTPAALKEQNCPAPAPTTRQPARRRAHGARLGGQGYRAHDAPRSGRSTALGKRDQPRASADSAKGRQGACHARSRFADLLSRVQGWSSGARSGSSRIAGAYHETLVRFLNNLPEQFKWASDQEAVTFLGYRPIRS